MASRKKQYNQVSGGLFVEEEKKDTQKEKPRIAPTAFARATRSVQTPNSLH
jgi:hypothetical protein